MKRIGGRFWQIWGEQMDNGGVFTDRLLSEAEIRPGQSAVDVGCGPGDVTFRLAKLVGPRGRVVGVDLNEAALEVARQRAVNENFENVTFVRGDIYELPPLPASGFDVISCRRLLMYLPDKVRAIRCMLERLRPGGQLMIQEHDCSVLVSSAPLPLTERIHRMIWDTVAAEGAETALGTKLYSLLDKAGASDICVTAEAIVQTADQAPPTGMIVAAMADRIIASGVATKQELNTIDAETLDSRLAEERRAANASFIGEMIFGIRAKRTG